MKTSFALSAVLFAGLGSLVLVDCGGSAVSDGSAGAAGEATNAGAPNGGAGATSAGASSVGGAASGSAGNSSTGGVDDDAGSGGGPWDGGAAGDAGSAGASIGGSGGTHAGGAGSGGAAAGAGGGHSSSSTWLCDQTGVDCFCVLVPPQPGKPASTCTAPVGPCCYLFAPEADGKLTACHCRTEEQISCAAILSANGGTRVAFCPPP